MIKVIVFSKDRACQLDLTLRSILQNLRLPYSIEVLWTCSNREFEKGYEELFKIYSKQILNDMFRGVKFKRQSLNFKKDVLEMLQGDYKYLVAFGDDVVLTSQIGEKESKVFTLFDANPQILAVKFWQGLNTISSYEDGEPEVLPTFFYSSLAYQNFPIWNWVRAREEGKVNWGYSMNLMTQFYRKEDIVDYWKELEFLGREYDCPNMLEGIMMTQPLIEKQFMVCFPESKMAELTYNRVQTVAPNNRYGNTSAEEFNKAWLDGNRISFDVVDGLFHSNYIRYANRPFELIER